MQTLELPQLGTDEGAITQDQHHRNTADSFHQKEHEEPDGQRGTEESPPEQQHPGDMTNAFYPGPHDRDPYNIGGVDGASSPASTATRESDAALAPVFTQFSVEVSYLEIYNETLRDLFNSAAPAPAGSRTGDWVGAAASAAGRGGGGGGRGAASGGDLRLREDPRYIHRVKNILGGGRFLVR